MKLSYKYLLAIIPLIIVGSIIFYFSDIVSYIVVAWALSMIGAPVVKMLRKYVGKNASAMITLSLFVLFFSLLLWIFVPPLLTQARNLAGIDYTSLVESLEEPISDWENWLADKGLISKPDEVTEKEIVPETEKELVYTQLIRLDSILQNNPSDTISQNNPDIALLIKIDGTHENGYTGNGNELALSDTDTFFDRVRKNLYSFLDPSHISQLFGSVIGTLSSFLIGIMSVLFIAFFFLREQGLFNKMVSSAIPDRFEDQTVQAIDQTSTLLIRYFTGILAQMTVITLFVSILLSILGIKNALLIGFFAALMNVIPYIGPVIGAVFAIIITISSNLAIPFYSEMVPLLLKVLAVFGVMQLLDNFILQPNIFSKSVKAHPLEIFLVVLIGAKIGGIGGMVLAIPVYTVLRVIGKVFLSEFKVVQSITRGL